MLIIRLVMVRMGPKHTQYGQKTARLAPVLQNGLKGHVRPPSTRQGFWALSIDVPKHHDPKRHRALRHGTVSSLRC